MKNIFYSSVTIKPKTYFIFSTNKGICLVTGSLKEGHNWLKKTFKEYTLIEDPEWKDLKNAKKQLEQYTEKSSTDFNLRYDLYGTPFQVAVWNELNNIAYGKTKTYKDVAVAINRPKATRAVGAACGKNPVMIFIPCHRVIGSNGSLTGYGGGLKMKKNLLDLEMS